MAWNGYFEFAGNEIINLPRTEVYARDQQWFRPTWDGRDLPLMNGDRSYHTPLVDNAPWTDPDVPVSYEFWGLYPLDITGIEDATVTSVVTESTGDGGVPGRVRRGTKTVVFNGMLLAKNDCAADYGVKWLRSVLNGNPCTGNAATLTCNGDDLCFLTCEPVADPVYPQHAEDCLELRSLRRMVFNTGPTITAKRVLSDGGATWMVTFTGVAGSPYEFGMEKPIVVGFMDPTVTDPYVPGVDGMFDLNGEIVDETQCATPILQPVFDPLCPALVVPPTLPNVPLGCFFPPANWRRRQFTIPNEMITMYSDAVPYLKVYARDGDVRNLRLRFYADVDGDGQILSPPDPVTGERTGDECAWCGDIVLSYIPQDMTLVFDGTDEVVWVETPGGTRRRADNLVYATDGGPFEWPTLSCGFGYIVTVDLPQTQPPPVLDFSIYNRVA